MSHAHDLYVWGTPFLLLLLAYLMPMGKRLIELLFQEATGSVLTRLRGWPYRTPFRNRITRGRVRRAAEDGSLTRYRPYSFP